jgi:hypothetical protein
VVGPEQPRRPRGVALRVLDGLRLVEDHVVEWHLLEERRVAPQGPVGGQDDVVASERGRLPRPVEARVVQHAQAGGEALGLGPPVEDERAGDGHQRGRAARVAPGSVPPPPGLEQGQDLDRLPEPHVVGAAAAQAELLEEAEPPQAFALVVPQLAAEAPRGIQGGDALEAHERSARPPSRVSKRRRPSSSSLVVEGDFTDEATGRAPVVGGLDVESRPGWRLLLLDPQLRRQVEVRPPRPRDEAAPSHAGDRVETPPLVAAAERAGHDPARGAGARRSRSGDPPRPHPAAWHRRRTRAPGPPARLAKARARQRVPRPDATDAPSTRPGAPETARGPARSPRRRGRGEGGRGGRGPLRTGSPPTRGRSG